MVLALVLLVVVGLPAAFLVGYLVATARIDRTVASMGPEELRALDKRVKAQRALRR